MDNFAQYRPTQPKYISYFLYSIFKIELLYYLSQQHYLQQQFHIYQQKYFDMIKNQSFLVNNLPSKQFLSHLASYKLILQKILIFIQQLKEQDFEKGINYQRQFQQKIIRNFLHLLKIILMHSDSSNGPRHQTEYSQRPYTVSEIMHQNFRPLIISIYFIIKMNAAIKLNHIQYLHVLQELLLSKIQHKDDKVSTVKLPFFNFIDLLISILIEYTKQSTDEPLNMFILRYFIQQHRSAFQLYRHMQGFIAMWKKYVECHEEARLYLSILNPQRSTKESVKLFLKIRKTILRNLGTKIMQEIYLSHQDIITLSHTIFTPQMKSFTSRKIHQMFFSLKKKSLYSNNKINGAVICQFLMNCAQKFQRQQLENIQTYMEHAPKETEQYMKKRVFKPLELHYNDNFMEYLEPETDQSPQEKQIFYEGTGKFKFQIEQKQPRQNYFIANNFTYTKNNKEDSLSADKKILNSKYSNSWQRFLQTNKEIKQKLLKSHK